MILQLKGLITSVLPFPRSHNARAHNTHFFKISARHPCCQELGKQLHPLGRVGTGVDVAEAISFLIDSRKSGWMTGVTLPVDGGRLMTCSSGATLSGEGVPGDDAAAAADAAENEAAD